MRAARWTAGLAIAALFAVVADAEAVPSFSRQTGLTCNQCHVSFGGPVPNFTFTGKKFRINGYRMPFIAEKIEAGEPGNNDGNRLSIPLAPYLSLRYQSVFASQSKAPGYQPGTTNEFEKGPIVSNPTNRLSIFPAGALGDNIGLWAELYLTTDGSATQEWSQGLFSFDEYDLRFVKMLDNSTLGFGINNQSINEIAGFGPWPVGITSYFGTGNFGGWSHPNRAHLFAYGWFNDRLLGSVMAGTGENNLDWEERFYAGMVAFAPWNSDAKELWFMAAGQFGNDGIPIVTSTRPSRDGRLTWSYGDAVQGIAAARAAAGAPNATLLSSDVGDYARIQTEVRYGFADSGPHSLETMLRFVTAREEYETQEKAEHDVVAAAVRYVFNRTWGFDLVTQKDLNYKFTAGDGTEYDVETPMTFTTYLSYKPAMNFLVTLSGGNSRALSLTEELPTGWNWSLGVDFLF